MSLVWPVGITLVKEKKVKILRERDRDRLIERDEEREREKHIAKDKPLFSQISLLLSSCSPCFSLLYYNHKANEIHMQNHENTDTVMSLVHNIIHSQAQHESSMLY